MQKNSGVRFSIRCNVTSIGIPNIKITRLWHCRIFIVGISTLVQYIPRNMHKVFALLCFVVVIHWLIFHYPSGLLHWHCGNLTIAPVPAKQPWWIWINTSCEFIMNDCITTTKQSTTKPCAYFLGYTVREHFHIETSPRKLLDRARLCLEWILTIFIMLLCPDWRHSRWFSVISVMKLINLLGLDVTLIYKTASTKEIYSQFWLLVIFKSVC